MKDTNRQLQSNWLTIREAADYLKVARSTLYRWAREGKVTFYRLGEQTVRVQKDELDTIAQPSSHHRAQQEHGTLMTLQSAIWKLVGIAEGPADLAANHDRYLAGAKGKSKK
jgi:excisionase family DNA binding protein